MERTMQHLTYSTLESAALFLSAKTGDQWTPELILDRLHRLLSDYCEGLGMETVRILLPAGWQVQDALTGEHIRLSRPTVVEVSQAGDFIDQLRSFGDAATASGRPLAVVLGPRRLHTVDLIPASAVRLLPSDLFSLANLPQPESITPYWDLVTGIRDGLYPAPFGDDEEVDDDDEPHLPQAGPVAMVESVAHPSQSTEPTPTPDTRQRPDETAPQPDAIDAEIELAALFDPVKVATLEAMFPDEKWGRYAEKAPRNGLNGARVGRGIYNPYLAARWWLHRQAPAGWKWERCVRVLANNLPVRSRDSKHLLTGDFD